MSEVWLITGIMAAGKSTVAQLLAERFERSAHVRGDVFRRMIVQGREEMSMTPTEGAIDQLRLRYRLGASTADSYATAGFTTVVQDIVLGPHLGSYVETIRTRPLHVVVLAPSADTVVEREAERSKVGYRETMAPSELDHVLRDETPRIGLWLDTSDQTPQQTVDEILRRADDSLV